MKIIFFDGVCGLCNGFVDFILKIDKKRKFHFSPLQGEYAAKTLPRHLTKELSSLAFMSNGKIYTKSEAVLMILSETGGFWALSSIFRIIPKSFQNVIYDFVAKYRYVIFGKKSSCRLPTSEERSRFVI